MSWSASAPGRLDVMGGIADYSGSVVLQTPIEQTTECVVRRIDKRSISIRSESRDGRVEVGLERLLTGGDLHEYDSARTFFRLNESSHWASYPIGVILALVREEAVVLESGLELTITSKVPEGKGVSSSAALEVATMRALAKALALDLDPVRVAVLCQRAENLVAGAPCGIMDQMTAACGERGKLMRLLCQPATLQGFVDLPPGVAVWGIDSGIRHAVTGSNYGDVRAAAFMGFEIVKNVAGEEAARFDGYLVNVGPEALRERFLEHLPELMSGTEFLDRYSGISDTVSQVDPYGMYRVKACTEHPVLEHARIRQFAALLESADAMSNLTAAGSLMLKSHEGYGACGLGSDGTDLLVEMVKEVGPEGGLFGARIAGGGSGGTVVILGRTDAQERVEQIARDYQTQTRRDAQIF